MQEYIQQMPDGRTRVEREVEGGFVTIYFSEKDDEGTLEKVKSMIMDAYAERKLREGKLSNCDQLWRGGFSVLVIAFLPLIEYCWDGQIARTN